MQSVVLASSSDRLVYLAAAPSIFVYPGVCWKATQTHISISDLQLGGTQGLKAHGHIILAQWGQCGLHKEWDPVVLGWTPRVHGGHRAARATQVRPQPVPKLSYRGDRCKFNSHLHSWKKNLCNSWIKENKVFMTQCSLNFFQPHY